MANTVVSFSINIEGIDSINKLNKEIKDTKAAFNETTDAANRLQLGEKLAKLQAEQIIARKEQKKLTDAILETSDALGAYDKASIRLNNLRKQYKDLAIAGKGASEESRAMLKEIKALDTQLKSADASVGQFQRNVGNYPKTFMDAADSMGALGQPAKVAIGAFQGIGVAIRFMISPIGIAIAAIGAIVMSLKAFFAGSEEGQNKLRKFQEVFAAVFNVIENVAETIGGAIVTVIEGIGSAINYVVSSIAGANNQLSQAAKDAASIAAQQDALDKKVRENIVKNAKDEQQVAELRNKAAQKDKYTREQRLAFLEEAIKRENDIMLREEDSAKRSFKIAKDKLKTYDNDKDALDAVAQAEANLINVRTQNAEATRRLQSQRAELTKSLEEEAASAKKAQEEAYKRAQELKKEREEFQKANAEFLENSIKLNQSIIQKTEELTTSFITDEYKKRRVEAQKAFDNEVKDLQKSIEDQKKLNAERFAETVKQFGAQSKQAIDFKKQTDAQELQAQDELDSFLLKRKLKLTDDFLKIDKDESQQYIDLKKKQFEARATAEQRSYTNQKNLLEKNLNEQLVLAGNNQDKIEALNKQYQDDLYALEKKRIEDEIALNEQKTTTITGLNQDEKNAIISQNIALNTELSKLEAERTKNAAAESEKRTAKEKEEAAKRTAQLQKDIETVGQYTQLALDTVSGLIQAGDEARMKRLEKDAEANAQIQANLEERLQNATGLERRYLEQQLRTEKQNAEAIAKAQEEAEKNAAKKQKAIALIQSIINGALAISKAVASAPPPFNIPAIVAASIQAAAQTAVIAAQPLAKGGVVGKGDEIVQFAEGGRVTNRGNIKPLSNGDNVLATLKTGEIVLNEAQQRRIGYGALKAARIPNFANGGFVGAPTSLITSANNTIATEQMRVNLMDEMIKATNQRMDRLTVVYTATTDYEVEKSRNDKKTIKQNATF